MARDRKRLNTAKAIRQQLAKLYHDLSEGEITENKARTLAYIASIMLKAVEISELEEKLDTIEKQVKEIKG